MNRRSLLKLVAAVVPASWLPMPKVAPVAKEWSQVVREAVPAYLDQEAARQAKMAAYAQRIIPGMVKRLEEKFSEEFYADPADDRLRGIEHFIKTEQPNYGSD